MARLTQTNANYRRHLKRNVKGDKLWAPGRSCTGLVHCQTILVKRLGPTQSPLAWFWAENDTEHIRLSTLLTMVLNQLFLDYQISQRSSVVNGVEVCNYQSKLNVLPQFRQTGCWSAHASHYAFSSVRYSLWLLLITSTEALGRCWLTQELFKEFQLDSRIILIQFTSLTMFCHILL